jgi:glycosyltransferase involved in cell wall biosynthesis
MLTWSLTIATYRRHEVLMRSLRLAVRQTRPPVEIVVVDGSPNWQEGRERAAAVVGGACPLRFEPADRISSAAQRNQAIRLASGDVVFALDDDSLMYLDCAEEVMRVYEADSGGLVAGVCPVLVEIPPDVPSVNGQVAARERGVVPVQGRGAMAHIVRRMLRADQIFVPYDGDFPDRPIPEAVRALPTGRIKAMHGARMTFRRSFALAEPFEEVLDRYAAGEDSDASYRMSRHGALVSAHRARICHLVAPGGRLGPFTTTALGALNPAVCLRLHSDNVLRSRQRYKRLLARRLVIQTLNDLSRRRFALPNARGILYARLHLSDAFDRSAAELRSWYPAFQRRLLESDPRNRSPREAVSLAYMVPEFPGQTHAFFRREIDLLQGQGVHVETVSTRRPPAAELCHRWAENSAARTAYLYPPGASDLLSAVVALLRAGPRRWWRVIKAIATASGCGLIGRLRLAGLALMGARLAALARRRCWGHIHVHSAADSAAIAAFCRMLGGPPYSLTLHGALKHYGGPRAAALKWHGAEFAITVTQVLRNEVLAAVPGLDRRNVEVAPMGVDLSIFRRSAPRAPLGPGEALRVVTCGRLHHGKGHQDLIEAIAGLDGATLTVIGAGPARGDLESLAASRGLSSRVRFAGALSEEQVRDELERAHVFALASREEALGVATMEAMAMELPVVVTGVGPEVAGVGELVRDGVEGILLPPRDPGAFTEALRRLARDPDLAGRMGRCGRARVEDGFDGTRSALVIGLRLGVAS